MMRSRVAPLAAAAAVLAVAGAAHAYILPNDYLVGLIDARLGKVEVLRLEGELTAGDGVAATSAPATLTLRAPGDLVLEHSGEKVEAKGVLWPTPAPAVPVPTGLLVHWVGEPDDGERVYRSERTSMLLERLEKAGVDLERRSLGRFHGRVVVIIGAKPWERDRPQVWIDRDRQAPMRLMVREGLSQDGALWDLAFWGFGSREHGDLVPTHIEARRGDELVARFEVESSAVNPR